MFCGSAVMAVIFIIWEIRMGEEAMIPIPMVRQQVVWSSALNFSLLMMSVMVGSNFMPIYLQSVKALSPTMSGVYMLASILSQTVFVVLSGALGMLTSLSSKKALFSISIQVLTLCSFKNGILHSLGFLCGGHHRRWSRTCHYLDALLGRGNDTRISDPARCPRCRHADGKCQSSQKKILNHANILLFLQKNRA